MASVRVTERLCALPLAYTREHSVDDFNYLFYRQGVEAFAADHATSRTVCDAHRFMANAFRERIADASLPGSCAPMTRIAAE